MLAWAKRGKGYTVELGILRHGCEMGNLSEMGGMIGGDKNTWRGMRKKNVRREIQTQVKRGNLLGPS